MWIAIAVDPHDIVLGSTRVAHTEGKTNTPHVIAPLARNDPLVETPSIESYLPFLGLEESCASSLAPVLTTFHEVSILRFSIDRRLTARLRDIHAATIKAATYVWP